MPKVRKIEKDGLHLATFLPAEAWEKGSLFFSDDSDFVQVGTWNYDAGKKLLAHRHNIVPRESNRTQEVIYIVSGSLKAEVMDEAGALAEVFILKTGDTLILLRGAHGYEILEENTKVLEVKNGPYFGAEADRVRI